MLPLADIPNQENKMKTIPAGTKVYKTLAACCRYQHRLPAGVQPVFDIVTRESAGFAALQSGEYWVTKK